MRKKTLNSSLPPRSAPAGAGVPLPTGSGPSRLSHLFGGLKQRDIADIIGCTESYISLLERGKRVPSIAFAQKVAEACHKPLNEVLAVFVT